MGNNPSPCAGCSKGFLTSRDQRAVLLDTAGNTRKLRLPLKSAEIMIEEPGHVIAPVDELRRTRRIAALPADHDLQRGKAYLLVPASRVHSRASEFEIAITEPWDSDKKKRRRRSEESKRKEGVSGNMVKVVAVVSIKEGQSVVLKHERFGSQEHWNPVLEPILESP